MKRSRLPRKSKSGKKFRLKKNSNPKLEGKKLEEMLTAVETSAEKPSKIKDLTKVKEKGMGLLDTLKHGEKELEHGVGELAKGGGAFLHELIYLETPEEVRSKKLVVQAKKLMAMHPSESVWLKVMLEEEPEGGSGLSMVVRADDLSHFNELEAEDLDSGNIYTIRRNNIIKIIGISKEPHASTPAFPESSIPIQ